MNQQRYFIVSLSWIDVLTLGSLMLSSLGLWFAFQETLTLAIGFMLLSMLVDMFDGLLARRIGLESEFGKYLDGFCDVFAYLVLPLFILFQFGMQDLFSICVLFIFLVGGLLRLSRFNIISTVEEGGVEYHLGLQVIWSHLLVVLAFPAWRWLGGLTHYLLALVLFVMSIFMILNVRFPKPTHYISQTIVILFVASVYFYLHFKGIHAP